MLLMGQTGRQMDGHMPDVSPYTYRCDSTTIKINGYQQFRQTDV